MTRRVAIVTPTLSHFEVPLYRLMASFEELDLTVYHCDPRGKAFFDESYGRTIDWGEDTRAGYSNSYSSTMREACAAAIRSRPHALLQYGFSSRSAIKLLLTARAQRIPVVHRGLLSPYRNTMQSRFLGAAWRVIRPSILRLYAAHHYGGDYGKSVLDAAGIPDSKKYFVPFSVDSPHFLKMAADPTQTERAMQFRRALGWGPDAPVMLFIGQHSQVKAPDIAIEVARILQQRVPDLKFLVVGSGPLTDALKARAEAVLRKDSWHFTGYVSSKDTPHIYLTSTFALFPSRYDTWARAVNEAMLIGRPCIVSKYVGAAGGLVVNSENGYVVHSLAPEHYVDCVVTLLGQPPSLRYQMGLLAQARAQAYSYETSLENAKRSLLDVAMT